MEHGLSILPFTGSLLVVMLIALVLRYFKQPSVVAYIIAGIVLGPYCLGIFADRVMLTQLGSIGVLFLLFFVGMEISLPQLVKSWRVAIIGTALQSLLSVAVVLVLGNLIGWPLVRSVALGFVISLSSTAVVMKVLQDASALDSDVGRDVLSVLLVQDILIVPMLITLSFLGGEQPTLGTILLQVGGGAAIIATIVWVLFKQKIQLPFSHILRKDHEVEVIAALLLCFGLAVVTELCQLSAALGAFVAGIIVSAARETCWVSKSLEPFKVFFVGLFFVSIGMLIDLNFLCEHPFKIGFLVVAVFITNTFLNAAIFRALGDTVVDSLYAGALLSQIGELSFLVAAAGFRYGVLNEFSYQATVATISLTLLLSPAWIWTVRRMTVRIAR